MEKSIYGISWGFPQKARCLEGIEKTKSWSTKLFFEQMKLIKFCERNVWMFLLLKLVLVIHVLTCETHIKLYSFFQTAQMYQ